MVEVGGLARTDQAGYGEEFGGSRPSWAAGRGGTRHASLTRPSTEGPCRRGDAESVDAGGEDREDPMVVDAQLGQFGDLLFESALGVYVLATGPARRRARAPAASGAGRGVRAEPVGAAVGGGSTAAPPT